MNTHRPPIRLDTQETLLPISMALATLLGGCSLAADFSRFDIEDAGDGIDAAALDAAGLDAGEADAGPIDAGPIDAGCGAACGPEIRALVAGELHHCALVASGDVYCWGSNSHYQVSPREEVYFDAPTRVSLPARAIQITARESRSCAVLEEGTARCWGTLRG